MDSGLAHSAGMPEVADVASAPDATHAGDVPGFGAGYVAGGIDVTEKPCPGGVDRPAARASEGLGDQLAPSATEGRRSEPSAPPVTDGRDVRPQVAEAASPAPPLPGDGPSVTPQAASDASSASPLPGLPTADVVSVPEAAGREALTRLLGYGQPAVTPGPVALSAHGRVLFLVAPGGSEDLPELLDWLDWGGVHLDLAAYPLSGPAGLADPPVRWLHPTAVPLQRPAPAIGPDTPGAGAAAHPTQGLPEPPELIALLATIAAACHRLAVTRGGLPQSASD